MKKGPEGPKVQVVRVSVDCVSVNDLSDNSVLVDRVVADTHIVRSTSEWLSWPALMGWPAWRGRVQTATAVLGSRTPLA